MSVLTTTIRMEDSQFFARLNAMEARLGSLAANFAAIAGRMAVAFAPVVAGVGGVTAATLGMKKAIDEASNMQQLQAAFEVLIGSADVAKATLAGLQRFADETVFQMPELADAAKQLMAFGVGATDVVSNLRMLGDVAAGLKIPLSELVEVYGRNLVQGRLFSRDIYQFQSRGIPIIAELAKQFGVAENQIMGMTEAGQIGSAHMEKAFRSLTAEGGLFAGMLEKQSRTFAGRMSALSDTINAAFREMGKPLIAVLGPIVERLIERIRAMTPAVREFGERVARIINGIANAFDSGRFTELVGVALELGFRKALIILSDGLGRAVAGFSAGISASINSPDLWTGLLQTLLGIAGAFGAAILRAIEKPLWELGKAINGTLDFANNARAKKGYASAREEVLSTPEFNSPVARKAIEDWGSPFAKVTEEQRKIYERFAAAVAKIAPEHLRKAGYIDYSKVEQDGPVTYLNGKTAAEMGTDALAEMKTGLAKMSQTAPVVAEAIKKAFTEYRSDASDADKTAIEKLEAKLKDMFPPLPVSGDAGDAANARKGNGTGEIMGGGSFDIVADSLAKLGGGGGVAGISSALEEAREQTRELKTQTGKLEEIKQVILTGRINGAEARLEITQLQ